MFPNSLLQGVHGRSVRLGISQGITDDIAERIHEYGVAHRQGCICPLVLFLLFGKQQVRACHHTDEGKQQKYYNRLFSHSKIGF